MARMGSKITVEIWSNHPASRSLASDVAEAGVRVVRLASGDLATAVASIDSVTLEPNEVAQLVEFNETEDDDGSTPDQAPSPTVEPSPAGEDFLERLRAFYPGA